MNPSRLRVLVYFTGGNPRLVLMLYQVVTQADFVQDNGTGLWKSFSMKVNQSLLQGQDRESCCAATKSPRPHCP